MQAHRQQAWINSHPEVSTWRGSSCWAIADGIIGSTEISCEWWCLRKKNPLTFDFLALCCICKLSNKKRTNASTIWLSCNNHINHTFSTITYRTTPLCWTHSLIWLPSRTKDRNILIQSEGQINSWKCLLTQFNNEVCRLLHFVKNLYRGVKISKHISRMHFSFLAVLLQGFLYRMEVQAWCSKSPQYFRDKIQDFKICIHNIN